jgi:tripartite-type tricarboxylate transporter receptor subunit TctC
MRKTGWFASPSTLLLALLLAAACAPTPAARPAPAPPAQPAANPTAAPAAQSAPAPAAKPAAGGAAQPAFDERAVADFYRGKTVRIVVGFAAGGGYDTYSRVIGRHIRKYIPGNPTVIVENMPGAGSILATNHLYNAGAKDGTLIGNISGPIILEQLFNAPGVEYDMAKLRYLAVPTAEAYIMIVTRKPGVTTFEEVLGPSGKQVVVGGIPGSTVEHAPILLRDVLGANIRLVSGYDGTSKVRLAIDTGEVDGFFNTWQSVKITNRAQIDSGEWLALAALSDTPLKDLPNVPTIPAIARTDEQRQILRFGTYVPNQFGKVYAVASEVPADRAAALEVAFAKTLADPEFLADADKSSLEIDPLYGEDIHKLVVEMLGMPTEIKSKLQEAMRPAGR